MDRTRKLLDAAGARSAGTPCRWRRFAWSLGLVGFLLASVVEAFVPDDPKYVDQWGLVRIGLPEAWDVTLGTADVVVAVLDSGVNYAHEDSSSNYLFDDDWDFVNDDDDAMDDNWHGTWMTGILAAATDNAVGVAGVAPGISVLGVKVLNASGSGTYEQVAAGIDWAVSKGAQVLCMPLGGSPNSTVSTAIANAEAAGVLPIAAVGNNGSSNGVSFPASLDEVVAVGAVKANDTLADFSNRGPEVELVAPGDSIWTTDLEGYAAGSGTTLATMHVCGVAALLFSLPQELTASEVRSLLSATAEDLGASGWDTSFGHGLVRADEAIDAAFLFRDGFESGDASEWSSVVGGE